MSRRPASPAAIDAIPPKARANDLVARLRHDILRGGLEPGLPLRQDEIAARCGVSKIPVREALLQLVAEGLVAFQPNRGFTVARAAAGRGRGDPGNPRGAGMPGDPRRHAEILTDEDVAQRRARILDQAEVDRRARSMERPELGVSCEPLRSCQAQAAARSDPSGLEPRPTAISGS